MILRLGAVLACCLAFAACGDDGDGGGGGDSGRNGSGQAPKEQVFQGLRDYGEAVRANDPAAACDKLTEEAQGEAAQTFPGADDCEDAHRQAFAALGPLKRNELAEQLGGVTNYEAEVSGNNATLTFPGRPGAKPLKMRRVGGDWKVAQNTLFFNRDED